MIRVGGACAGEAGASPPRAQTRGLGELLVRTPEFSGTTGTSRSVAPGVAFFSLLQGSRAGVGGTLAPGALGLGPWVQPARGPSLGALCPSHLFKKRPHSFIRPLVGPGAGPAGRGMGEGGQGAGSARPAPPRLFPADILALTFPGHRRNSLPPAAPCQPPL